MKTEDILSILTGWSSYVKKDNQIQFWGNTSPPNTTLSLHSWAIPSAECHWKPLSRFGRVTIPHSGCGWEERWHPVPFSPGATTRLPPPRPTFPCFHIHGSVYWLMMSTWNPVVGKTTLCQCFSISVPLWSSFVRRPGGWQPSRAIGECLRRRLWGLKSCKYLRRSVQGYARAGFFFFAIPKHVFVFCQMLTLTGG